MTIVSSAQPTTFNVGGVDYTLVDELSRQRQSGVRIHHEGRRPINTSDLVGQFTFAAGTRRCSRSTKSGPATMNLGQWGDFVIDVQNTGLGDAWNVIHP